MSIVAKPADCRNERIREHEREIAPISCRVAIVTYVQLHEKANKTKRSMINIVCEVCGHVGSWWECAL